MSFPIFRPIFRASHGHFARAPNSGKDRPSIGLLQGSQRSVRLIELCAREILPPYERARPVVDACLLAAHKLSVLNGLVAGSGESVAAWAMQESLPRSLQHGFSHDANYEMWRIAPGLAVVECLE